MEDLYYRRFLKENCLAHGAIFSDGILIEICDEKRNYKTVSVTKDIDCDDILQEFPCIKHLTFIGKEYGDFELEIIKHHLTEKSCILESIEFHDATITRKYIHEFTMAFTMSPTMLHTKFFGNYKPVVQRYINLIETRVNDKNYVPEYYTPETSQNVPKIDPMVYEVIFHEWSQSVVEEIN